MQELDSTSKHFLIRLTDFRDSRGEICTSELCFHIESLLQRPKTLLMVPRRFACGYVEGGICRMSNLLDVAVARLLPSSDMHFASTVTKYDPL